MSSTITISGTSGITISGTSSHYTTTSGYINTLSYGTSGPTNVKFNILGEEYEHNGYIDGHISVAISTLNILGKPYWTELKNNGVVFPHEMEKFIEKRFLILERDKKIDDIIN
jgi:hypothetical protein